MTLPIAVGLVSVGLLVSLVMAFLNRRAEPHVKRWPPELHAAAILLSSGGAWLAWGWLVALGVAVAHGLVAFLLIRFET